MSTTTSPASKTTTSVRTAKVFIDGEAGTTGLGIRERLMHVSGITVRSIDPAKRKDPVARRELMAEVDAVVLCLPDDAAKESAALAASLGDKAPRVLDASTAHRVAPGWVYGFAELEAGQADAIRSARCVANPGCYPTGAIALIRPLVDAGLLPADYPVTVNAVSGYSGGGKSMIEAYEAGTAPSFELYGLALEHKHLPELQLYGALDPAADLRAFGRKFSAGHVGQRAASSRPLAGQAFPGDLEAVLAARYAAGGQVKVVPSSDPGVRGGKLEPEALNDTDLLELRVYGNAERNHALLVARLDNLGKGASGAAVQNLTLMLGLA